MSNMWIIFEREYMERVKKKSFLIATILTPLIFPLIIGVSAFLTQMDEDEDRIVYVVDEYISDGAGANKHARGILQMLRRNNLEIADITRWTGDRRHGGTKKGDGRMSNGMLMAGFAHELAYMRSGLPFKIKTAYKPKWSLLYGCQVIHERMINGKFQIQSCKNWLE